MRIDVPVELTQQPRLLDVVGAMVKFAHKGKTDLTIINLVTSICAGLEAGDYAGECLAIYYWVCQNIRYMRDIHDVEFIKEPARIVEARSGDCDDMATLLAAMLMVAGNKCSFVRACFDDSGSPSHVFVQVDTPAGPVPLDPVANFDTRDMLSRIRAKKVIPAQ